MNKKMIIRCALVGALALLAASCFQQSDYKTEYSSHLQVRFEYDEEYQWLDFVDRFFNGGEDTVAFKSIILGPITFCATLDKENNFQGGMVLCRGKDSDASAERKPSRFAVYDKDGGNQQSHAYAVFHDTTATLMPEHFIDIYIPNEDSSCAAEFVYVHNVQAAVQAAKHGVGLAGGPFQAEDNFILTITGYLKEKVTATKDVELIAGTKCLEEWTQVDISSLGKIDAIDFHLSSSRADFPMSCCLDDLALYYVEIYQ